MGSDYVALLLEGLPDPADQPDPDDPADPKDIFYNRMTRGMWDHVRPIAETVELPPDRPTDAQVRLYLSALARIAVHWWNPYKYGLVGDYQGIPDIRPKQTYLGHNIAALAVDDLGRVIDFEMNHNDLFRSSAEHAESRLVRRLYQLASVYQTWDEASDDKFDVIRIKLDKVTIYTTLQPCAQCAGIMTLARVKQAVFLQADPGMYFADVVMRALSPNALRAPTTMPASAFGIGSYRALNEAYVDYWTSSRAIHSTPDGVLQGERDMTAFLCTTESYGIFRSLAAEFDAAAPAGVRDARMDDAKLLAELKEFVRYACSPAALRGAPHRV